MIFNSTIRLPTPKPTDHAAVAAYYLVRAEVCDRDPFMRGVAATYRQLAVEHTARVR